jgi:hypothetical protein
VTVKVFTNFPYKKEEVVTAGFTHSAPKTQSWHTPFKHNVTIIHLFSNRQSTIITKLYHKTDKKSAWLTG